MTLFKNFINLEIGHCYRNRVSATHFFHQVCWYIFIWPFQSVFWFATSVKSVFSGLVTHFHTLTCLEMCDCTWFMFLLFAKAFSATFQKRLDFKRVSCQCEVYHSLKAGSNSIAICRCQSHNTSVIVCDNAVHIITNSAMVLGYRYIMRSRKIWNIILAATVMKENIDWAIHDGQSS